MDDLIRLMRCPFCTSDFDYDRRGLDSLDKEYGFLICSCSTFPVISGIPVIKPLFDRESENFVKQLSKVIDIGNYDDVIYCLLYECKKQKSERPYLLKSNRIQLLKNIKNSVKKEIELFQLHRRDFERIDKLQSDKLNSFNKYVDLFFPKDDESTKTAYEYFTFKFGQPRHFVALALMELIENIRKPVLEVACGFGPLTRHSVRRAGKQKVIGTDKNLFMLYVAGRYIAPDAKFVCCDANYPLPFKDNSFSTVTCFDGIHYIQNKFGFTAEVKRTADTDDYLYLFGSTRNAHIDYRHAGYPYTTEKYSALVQNMNYRIMPDTKILQSYLRKEMPDMEDQVDIRTMRDAPLLSIVVSRNPATFTKSKQFTDWPHGGGRLGINPLYTIQKQNNNDEIVLIRNFPSRFYELDNAESKEYLPERVTTRRTVFDDIENNRRSPEVEKLIDSFVVLDLPESYN